MKTTMRAGRLVAAYVDDGQGRRLVLALPREDGHVAEHALTFATTQAEAKAAIATLRQLAEELPPGEGVPRG